MRIEISNQKKIEAGDDITANLKAIRDRMDDAAREAGRDPADVSLVAVSKTHPQERIREALDAGHRLFGENRVQEAAAKFPALREDFPDLKLHLIGPLQTNKASDAVALFDMIETVDRPKLARKLAKEMDKAGRQIPCLVQVNIGEEEQKAGIPPHELDDFLKLCIDECGLDIRGLMCIPPLEEIPAPHFALLARMAGDHGLKTISMGMSGDFETAITFGATLVRVGTAIFGSRPKPA